MGQWTVRTFWVDGTVKEAAKFSIKVYSPSLKPVERYVENVSLSSKNRYSQEISFKLQK